MSRREKIGLTVAVAVMVATGILLGVTASSGSAPAHVAGAAVPIPQSEGQARTVHVRGLLGPGTDRHLLSAAQLEGQAPLFTVQPGGCAGAPHCGDETTIVSGAAGPGSPAGTVTFYICGPAVAPESCTSSTGTEIGTVTLVPNPDGDNLTSVAPSPGVTPAAGGYWCFAAYYSGAPLSSTGYYQPSADTSSDAPGLAINPVAGTPPPGPYDGCFDATS